MRERIEELYPEVLLETEIPEDVKATGAPGHGEPVTIYMPSATSAAYRRLATQLEEKLLS